MKMIKSLINKLNIFKRIKRLENDFDSADYRMTQFKEKTYSRYWDEKLKLTKLWLKMNALQDKNKTHINCFNGSENSHLLYLIKELEDKIKNLEEGAKLDDDMRVGKCPDEIKNSMQLICDWDKCNCWKERIVSEAKEVK